MLTYARSSLIDHYLTVNIIKTKQFAHPKKTCNSITHILLRLKIILDSFVIINIHLHCYLDTVFSIHKINLRRRISHTLPFKGKPISNKYSSWIAQTS